MNPPVSRQRRLLLLTAGVLADDPRCVRAVVTAVASGLDVNVVCTARGAASIPESVNVVEIGGGALARRLRSAGFGGTAESRPLLRELRGLFRLARLGVLNLRLARATRTVPRADVVHANDLDTLPAAVFACRLGKRLVYDAHEVYADQEPDPPRLHRAAVRMLEGVLARRADAVVTVNKPIAAELAASLRLSRPPLVVLNAPSAEDVPLPELGVPLRVIYQGAMGPGRSVSDLVDAAARLTGVRLTIRVAGADVEALANAVEERGLEDVVEVLEPVAPQRLVAALANFDVGLVINRPVTLNDTLVLPNKIFEYLMAGLAVVAPALPALAELIEKEQVGLTYVPGAPADLARVLNELAETPEAVLTMRRRAHRAARERYNAETQRPQLLLAWGL